MPGVRIALLYLLQILALPVSIARSCVHQKKLILLSDVVATTFAFAYRLSRQRLHPWFYPEGIAVFGEVH
jgi:isoaspartyl peptidase/L-asparaginase-like protein (Ntn-hydrolase superfamily)